MRFKKVFRYDYEMKLFRLFRLTWVRGRGPGHGVPANYERAVKVALSRKPFYLKWLERDKVVTVFFVRLTVEKSY